MKILPAILNWYSICSLKKKRSGKFVENNLDGYTISIVNRGEQLLYEQNGKAILIEISIPGNWVDRNTISLWDAIRPVTSEEQDMIATRIVRYFANFQGTEIKLINDRVQAPR